MIDFIELYVYNITTYLHLHSYMAVEWL